jgi:hypothetical protein
MSDQRSYDGWLLVRRSAALTVALVMCGSSSCKRAPVAPASLPGDGARGVEVWPGLAEEAPGDVVAAWTAPWLNGLFFIKNGHATSHKQRRIANCAALDGIREDDVELGPEWEHYNFREKSIRCRAMARVRGATGARVGYLRDVLASNDPGDLLPSSLVTGPKPSASLGPGSSWRAVDPTLRFDRAGARADHRELVLQGVFRGRLTWWAGGDFDGDGVEDALVFLNLAPTNDPNAPNVMRAFIITRRQPDAPVTIVEKLD